MTDDLAETLPPEAELALAWCGSDVREPLRVALQLDRRLARIVTRTTEPMLGQMRLAWWRDALAQPAAERPRGDVVLDGIGLHWAAKEAALIAMVDGWEIFVSAQTLCQSEAVDFGMARGAFFAALVPENAERMAMAGSRWALADAAAAMSDGDERAAIIAAGLANIRRTANTSMPFPKGLRGLAVLDALAQRALERGGRPLMEGRGASLAAFKAAIFGN